MKKQKKSFFSFLADIWENLGKSQDKIIYFAKQTENENSMDWQTEKISQIKIIDKKNGYDIKSTLWDEPTDKEHIYPQDQSRLQTPISLKFGGIFPEDVFSSD